MAGFDGDLLHGSIDADDYMQDHVSFDACFASQRRIFRLWLADEFCRHHLASEFDSTRLNGILLISLPREHWSAQTE